MQSAVRWLPLAAASAELAPEALPIVRVDIAPGGSQHEIALSTTSLVEARWRHVHVGQLVAATAGTATAVTTDDVRRALLEVLPSELAYAEMLAALGPPPTRGPARSTAVAVCTADRPESLDRCLASIRANVDAAVPLLVVDNSRRLSDATREVAARHDAIHVREPDPGLDRARNRALVSTDAELVLFTDDDVEVEAGWHDWLAAAFDNPLAMAAGGLVLPAELATPSQIASEVVCSHGRGPFRVHVWDRGLASRGGVGASLAVRRRFVLAAGGFPEHLDAGMPTGTGGDTWVFQEVVDRGYVCVYEPRALARHWHRRDDDALRTMVEGNAAGVFALAIEQFVDQGAVSGLRRLAASIRWVLGNVLDVLRGRPTGYTPELVRAELRGMLTSPARHRRARRIVAGRPPVVTQRPTAPAPWLEHEPDVPPTDHGLPSVSVVVPTRDRAHLVVGLVESVLAAEHVTELVVVTDGDVDGTTAALAARFDDGRLSVLSSGAAGATAPLGAAAARNRGVAATTGDVVVFLDDDLELRSDRFFVRHARAHLGHDRRLVMGIAAFDERDGTSFSDRTMRNWWAMHVWRLWSGDPLDWPDVCTGNLSVRRTVFDELEGFRTLRRREDWDFGLRAMTAGVELHAVPSALAVQRPDHEPTFTDDAILNGAADAVVAGDHPRYGREILPTHQFEAGRRRRLGRWLGQRPDVARAVARVAVAVHDGVPIGRLKGLAFGVYWIAQYRRGRGHDPRELGAEELREVTSTIELTEPRSGPLHGGHHRITWRGHELGVLSPFQGGTALTSDEFDHAARGRFLHDVTRLLTDLG